MSNAKIAFTGVVMAGGRSVRMGRDKALLKLESGQTLLERAAETLRAAGAAEVVVAVGTGKKYSLPNAQEIPDQETDCGPIGGLAACLAEVKYSLSLVLAVDMPGMTPAYLRELVAGAEPGCGVVPMIDGSAEPLAAVYPKEASSIVEETLRTKEYSMQRLIRNLEQKKLVRLRPVNAGEHGLFANWNSPEDCR